MSSAERSRLGAHIRRDAIRALVEMHGPEFRRHLRAAYGHHERPPDWRVRDAWYGKVRAEAERVLIAAHRPEYARLRAVGYKVEAVKAKARPWIQSPLMASVPTGREFTAEDAKVLLVSPESETCRARVAARRRNVALLAEHGLSAEEICEVLAISRRTLTDDRHALGIPSSIRATAPQEPTARVADRRERVAELVARGWTAQQIAWDLAVDRRTIVRDKAALGLTRRSA